MLTKYTIKEREHGIIIEIILPSEQIFRISAYDGEGFITVQTPDESINIKPSVSNEIKISTNE